MFIIRYISVYTLYNLTNNLNNDFSRDVFRMYLMPSHGFELIGVVQYIKGFIDVAVIEHSKDVLSRSRDGTAKQKVGKAKVVVVPVQFVGSVLKLQ